MARSLRGCRLTKLDHPRTNGQVGRVNRPHRNATVKRRHSGGHQQLRAHFADVMAASNFARRLKPLGGLAPYEHIREVRKSAPNRFVLDPIQQMPQQNT